MIAIYEAVSVVKRVCWTNFDGNAEAPALLY